MQIYAAPYGDHTIATMPSVRCPVYLQYCILFLGSGLHMGRCRRPATMPGGDRNWKQPLNEARALTPASVHMLL